MNSAVLICLSILKFKIKMYTNINYKLPILNNVMIINHII